MKTNFFQTIGKAVRTKTAMARLNKTTTFGLALCGLALAGCLPTTVHPLYREADLMSDPALLGVWREKPEDKESWTFTPGEGKSYKLEIVGNNDPARFVAHFFKIRDERFLDLWPETTPFEEQLKNNPYAVAAVPAHLFFRVRQIEPALKLSYLDLKWLAKELKQKPNAVEHEWASDERVLLTDKTEALQAFLARHLNTAEAWGDYAEGGLTKAPAKPETK